MNTLKEKLERKRDLAGRVVKKKEKVFSTGKCNRVNLEKWLKARDPDNTIMSLEPKEAVRSVRKVLKDNITKDSQFSEKLFGYKVVGGTSQKILQILMRLYSLYSFQIANAAGSRSKESLKAEYESLSDKPLKKDISKRGIRVLIRKLKAKKIISSISSKIDDIRSNGFQQRAKRKRDSEKKGLELGGRVIGCKLDEQAKDLGIFKKSFDMSEELTGVSYQHLSRKKRKLLNHSFYKKLV